MTQPNDGGQTRPGVTVGLAALCAQWFAEVGQQSNPMTARLQADYDAMIRSLSAIFDKVIAPGVITTEPEAATAAALFRRESVDAVLMVHIMWSEDQPLLRLLRDCAGLPLLLWNYHPTGALPPYLSVQDVFRFSGTVGLLQGSAPLQRLGVTPHWIAGTPGDPVWMRDLADYAAALRIHREFTGLRAGRIAGPCDVMTGTHVNPEAFRAQLGGTLIEISAAEYAAACEAVAPHRADAWSAELTRQSVIRDVRPTTLLHACRNALALDDLVIRHNLAALAIQDLDPELHRLAGIRPCLYPPECARRRVAIAMESDLNTGIGLWVAMRAAASPGLYTEIFTFDPRANLLLLGHAAPHDPRLAAEARITLVPDAEYCRVDVCEGVWQEFILGPGPVTCVSLYDTGHGYRMVAFEGESLGPPPRIEGFAHASVRPDQPVQELLRRLVRRGLTQHFAVVPSRRISILRHWSQLQNVEFIGEQDRD